MINAIISLAVMGAIFGIILGIANKKFVVDIDPRVEAITNALPGANCGGCGFPGCGGYAEAIVVGTAPLAACGPGKDEVRKKIAGIMGADVGESKERKVAQLMCNGGQDKAVSLYEYEGILDCYTAKTMFGGPKVCSYSCIGLGSCIDACPFGCITMGDNHLPIIDYDLCVGCNKCVEYCPQSVIQLIDASKLVHVRCSNRDKGKLAKEACQVACIKCKLCEKNCPEGAIAVVDNGAGGLAEIDYSKCTNCGICVNKCPTNAIEKIMPINIEAINKEDTNNTQSSVACNNCGLCK
ncbi:MAG: RnfABCDGE type electron transport complex subunit B [Clostridia bacterium]|nr:RnfABCDGE type electron transport complex subunit B [Clostridia bacterium]